MAAATLQDLLNVLKNIEHHIAHQEQIRQQTQPIQQVQEKTEQKDKTQNKSFAATVTKFHEGMQNLLGHTRNLFSGKFGQLPKLATGFVGRGGEAVSGAAKASGALT